MWQIVSWISIFIGTAHTKRQLKVDTVIFAFKKWLQSGCHSLFFFSVFLCWFRSNKQFG